MARGWLGDDGECRMTYEVYTQISIYVSRHIKGACARFGPIHIAGALHIARSFCASISSIGSLCCASPEFAANAQQLRHSRLQLLSRRAHRCVVTLFSDSSSSRIFLNVSYTALSFCANCGEVRYRRAPPSSPPCGGDRALPVQIDEPDAQRLGDSECGRGCVTRHLHEAQSARIPATPGKGCRIVTKNPTAAPQAHILLSAGNPRGLQSFAAWFPEDVLALARAGRDPAVERRRHRVPS